MYENYSWSELKENLFLVTQVQKKLFEKKSSSLALWELGKAGKVHGKLHGVIKVYMDSSYVRFRKHKERSGGSAMSGGSSGDDNTNYTVRIFLCIKERKAGQWLIKNEVRKNTNLTNIPNPPT